MSSNDVHAEPKAARGADRKRFLVIGAGVGVATIVFGFGALWASDVLHLDGGPSQALAGRAVTSTSTNASRPDDAPPVCRAPLTPDEPLRLWIGGDSLAGSLGPSLGETTAATGVVQPVYDSRVSSGLSSPRFFDWPEHAAAEMARLDPELVVFIIGANDWRVPSDRGLDGSGGPAWRAVYAQLVEAMLAVLERPSNGGDVRPVYWVGAPTMEDSKQDAGARQINEVARGVVARHPDATYVDAYDLFSDSDGKYDDTLPGPNGKPVLVRAGDGIHFTPEGGDLLAAHVYDPVDARCDLGAQAVPGAAKTVIRTKGSTEVSGTNRGTATTSPVGGSAPPATLAAPVSPPTAPHQSSGGSPATSPTSAATAPPSTAVPPTTDPPTTDPTTPTEPSL